MSQILTAPEPALPAPSQITTAHFFSPKPFRFIELFILLPILAIAAGLRLWGLDQNGYGNSYYAAAVRSMLVNPTNFFFGSFDPAGLVTVDKPPVALWVQAISAKILGYSGISLLLPQALMGVATVGVLFSMLRPRFGLFSAMLGALVLAITPIAVAVDRDNLPDSLLTLVLMLAAWALLKSCERGKLSWLLVCVALVGVGFNVKMLAAFVVLPTFYLVYFFGTPLSLWRRLGHLFIATLVLSVVSLSWALIVEFYPKVKRPYIGGSNNNSALELALGYNGLGRVFGGAGNPAGMRGGPGGGMGSGGRRGNAPGMNGGQRGMNPPGNNPGPNGGPGPDGINPRPPMESGAEGPEIPPSGGPGGFPRPGGFPVFGGPGGFGGPPGMGGPGDGPGGFGGPPGFGGTPGFLRFAASHLGEQISWLLPMAFFGTLAFWFSTPWTGFWNGNWSSTSTSALLWAGWLATHWVVFTFAQGIFHDYYTIIMGPAIGALVGMGVVTMAKTMNSPNWMRSLYPTGLLLCVGLQAYLIGGEPAFKYNLVPAVLGVVALAVTWMVASPGLGWLIPRFPWQGAGAAFATAALLIGPALWSIGTAQVPGNSGLPEASAPRITSNQEPRMRIPGPMMGFRPGEFTKLLDFLVANRDQETILVAGQSSMEMSGLIIQSGESAVSIGGFNGGDAVLSRDQFVSMVEEGKLRFFLIGGGPGGGPNGPGGGRGPGRNGGGGRGVQGNGGDGMDGGPPPGGPGGGPGGPGGGPGSANREILEWVREHGKPVDPKFWQAMGGPGQPGVSNSPTGGPIGNFFGGFLGGPLGPPGGPMGGNRQLFDLKPEKGLVNPEKKP